MTNQIGNGSIPLRIGNLINTKVYGGPIRNCPEDMFAVKMAVEIDCWHNVSVPTVDYNVPAVNDLRIGVIKALMAMINNQYVYAGCWGGIGRTGLFLAALAKVQIEYRKTKHREGRGDDPVLYVRKHFIPHALETQEQMEYITNFDVSDIVDWLAVTQQAMGLNIGYQPKVTDVPEIARTDNEREWAGRVVEPDNICCPHCKYMNPADGACDCCGIPLPLTPMKQWVSEGAKVDNPAFNKYCQPWKEPKPLVERDSDWMDEIEADSASEFVAKDGGEVEYQEQIESLQNQVDELTNQVDELEDIAAVQQKINKSVDTRLTNTFKALESLGKACKVGFEEALTKPTIRERIRSWMKDSTYDGM